MGKESVSLASHQFKLNIYPIIIRATKYYPNWNAIDFNVNDGNSDGDVDFKCVDYDNHWNEFHVWFYLWLGEATEKLRTAVTAAEMCFPLTSKFRFHAGLDVCVDTIRSPFFTLALHQQPTTNNNNKNIRRVGSSPSPSSSSSSSSFSFSSSSSANTSNRMSKEIRFSQLFQLYVQLISAIVDRRSTSIERTGSSGT